MDEIDIHAKLAQIETAPHFSEIFDGDTERAEIIANHLIWLHTIRRERPLVSKPYKVGIYIRYFNQTRYENYLDFHKKGFVDTLALCPKWELVDFYIDEGSTAPNMENAPEWCRLLQDCLDGKVDLIITQKVSNVTKKPQEITIMSRYLATLPHPVGIYFNLRRHFSPLLLIIKKICGIQTFFPEEWVSLPDDDSERRLLHD